MPNYYDGTKLLSMRDLNGDIPEIYICTSNRTAGKTTYFNRKVHNGWNKYGKKYMFSNIDSLVKTLIKETRYIATYKANKTAIFTLTTPT